MHAKLHHIEAVSGDNKYMYISIVPNNKDKKSFIISKVPLDDLILSGEFIPKASLKADKTLGDLYVISMEYKDDRIYAISKTHNVIVVINPVFE